MQIIRPWSTGCMIQNKKLLYRIVCMTQSQKSRYDVCRQPPDSRILLSCCIAKFGMWVSIRCLQRKQNHLITLHCCNEALKTHTQLQYFDTLQPKHGKLFRNCSCNHASNLCQYANRVSGHWSSEAMFQIHWMYFSNRLTIHKVIIKVKVCTALSSRISRRLQHF